MVFIPRARRILGESVGPLVWVGLVCLLSAALLSACFNPSPGDLASATPEAENDDQASVTPAPTKTKTPAPTNRKAELDRNRTLWEARGADDYLYWYYKGCANCEYNLSAWVTVKNGSVASDSDWWAWGTRNTIDEWFGVIEGAIDEGAARVNVTYEAQLGYPAKIFIDYNADVADEELRVEISRYQLLTQTPAPTGGTFTSLSAGAYHSCGVQTGGAVICWGDDVFGQAPPPAGTYASVSAGGYHTCGVQTGGAAVCWGDGIFGQATAPGGTFASVSAGVYHTCGVQTDGTVVCWGLDYYGQATPPAGTFASVSAGWFHTCGVQTDGTVVCWGDDVFGQARPRPPAGTFASVSAGLLHTCGVTTGGAVACWGSNKDWNGKFMGQATPPAGTFTSVSAGVFHTCGGDNQ